MEHGGTEREGPSTPSRRVIAATVLGSALEFYDFTIYGTATALVLAGYSSRTLNSLPGH